ncbi:GHKL domain-containing protein [Marinifilum sp. N1E240]|uniref:sensor histidine kinase n=1 Tax=Marinifilum sp. N1E240 TaxID=2608082 RepID=UPI00128C1D57|nr:HAMP domain-containing sensor histidine kinase [Marinifilum sp. N1E240]MPQ48127.1 GHKL domain-containing protein [Marinifilum sp. N1E240]
MKLRLLHRIGAIIIFVLVVLVFSQVLWLSKQLDERKKSFSMDLENTLLSIVNFHALRGYSSANRLGEDTATISMERSTVKETNNDTSHELGRHEISTNKYIKNFSLHRAIEAAFIDICLANKSFKLEVIDSLFQNNFKDIRYVKSYELQILKNGQVIDSVCHGKIEQIKFQNSSDNLKIPLGTEDVYVFLAKYKLKKIPFLQSMIFSLSLSGIAIIFVALLLLWLLWALQQRAIQLQWREQTVRGIVHDLKSPLSYVYTLLDYIANKEHHNSMQEQLRITGTNVSKLITKIELILTIFSSKKKHFFMEAAPYNLSERCENLFAELSVTYKEKKPKCKMLIPKDLFVNVDPLYFEAVLRNLMDNAIKYSDRPAMIIISAIQEKKELLLNIEDLGIGISKKKQRKIFQEFYRVNNTTKGHGIGLTFSRQIIEAHEGRITLKSEFGKGSTFSISLPYSLVL